MTLYALVLHVSAAIAFAGICCRLLHFEHAHGLRAHAWTVAHVLLGIGLLARLFGMADAAAMLVTMGLALALGVRPHRRSTDA